MTRERRGRHTARARESDVAQRVRQVAGVEGGRSGSPVSVAASAGERLLDLVDEPDPYAIGDEEILPLQLEAAQEVLERTLPHVPLLARRVEEGRIDAIERIEDVVPLLFSHTVYKSYPQTFLTKGR